MTKPIQPGNWTEWHKVKDAFRRSVLKYGTEPDEWLPELVRVERWDADPVQSFPQIYHLDCFAPLEPYLDYPEFNQCTKCGIILVPQNTNYPFHVVIVHDADERYYARREYLLKQSRKI